MAAPKSRSKPSNKALFPKVLYNMLEDAANGGFEDILSWNTNGRYFKIHDRDRFLSDVLPRYARASAYKSFVRQLNLWGFSCVHGGRKAPDRGSYYHTYLVRGHPELCDEIVREKALALAGGMDAPPKKRRPPSRRLTKRGQVANINDVGSVAIPDVFMPAAAPLPVHFELDKDRPISIVVANNLEVPSTSVPSHINTSAIQYDDAAAANIGIYAAIDEWRSSTEESISFSPDDLLEQELKCLGLVVVATAATASMSVLPNSNRGYHKNVPSFGDYSVLSAMTACDDFDYSSLWNLSSDPNSAIGAPSQQLVTY